MAITGSEDTTWQGQGTRAADQGARNDSEGIGPTLRGAAYQKLTDQKVRASDTLGSVASAVRGMTDSLRDGGQSSVANYVNQAADGLDRWADRLRERDIDDAVRAVNDFARRQPVVFLGLAFGAGALLARFLKSSSADDQRSSRGSGGAWGGSSGRHGVASGSVPPVGAAGSGRSDVGGTSIGRSYPDTTGETPRASSDMPSAREVL